MKTYLSMMINHNQSTHSLLEIPYRVIAEEDQLVQIRGGAGSDCTCKDEIKTETGLKPNPYGEETSTSGLRLDYVINSLSD
ncbi:MAG: hypothetical protein AAFW84_30400 [Cyanobacteria bacterium J06635_15]